jgi:hypothetical protein
MPKPRTSYNAMGSLTFLIRTLWHTVWQERVPNYHKIIKHLLMTVFSSYVIFKKHGGKYTQLQFWMDIAQKLFLKYGGATPEA